MTIKEAEDKIINEFSFFDDWMDKYNYVIELGKTLPLIDETYKTANYLITGCQSNVWLHADYKDGKIYYSADSDYHQRHYQLAYPSAFRTYSRRNHRCQVSVY